MSRLVDIVKNNIRKALLVGSLALPLAFSSCEPDDDPPIPPPIKDIPPTATLSVSETYGVSPLTVQLTASGVKKTNDISTYVLYLDGEVLDSLPNIVDTSMTFRPGTHEVYAQVFDKKRLTGKTSKTTIIIDPVSGWSTGSPNLKVNYFVSSDSTAEYNSLNDITAKKDFLEMIRVSDITPIIPTGIHIVNGKEYGWACSQVSDLFTVNCIELGNNLYTVGGKLYDGYMGDNFDSIYVHHGTLKYKSTNKVPVYVAVVSASHQMNFAVVGNDLSKGTSLDMIEMMWGISRSDVQPGDGGGIPLDFDDFGLYFSCNNVDDASHNVFGNVLAGSGDITSGKINITDFNPNLDIIMERDTLPVGINVSSPVDGKEYASNNKILLDEVVTSGTNPISPQIFRYGYYSFDGGATKTKIRHKEHMDLIYNNNRYFQPGNYTLTLYAKNEFYKDASKEIHFKVK